MAMPCAPWVSPRRLKARVWVTKRSVIVTMANTSARVRIAIAATPKPISAANTPITGRNRNGS